MWSFRKTLTIILIYENSDKVHCYGEEQICYTCLMHYIVGLGNPGEEYERTRHNVGFMMLRNFVEAAGLPSFHESSAFSGEISEGVFEGEEVTILLPHTYMNASGSAIAKLVPKESLDTLLVIYDEVDLALGEMKISFGRGDGGHNGVRSIIEKLGSKDFTRLRIGISQKSFWSGKPVRPKGEALAKFVLTPFSKKEEKELQALAPTLKDMISLFLSKGKDALMNKYN
jgi:peptidyl-tRNA hydrolase, PTH1 family